MKTCKDTGYTVREDGFRHCNYCGSLDSVELAELIKNKQATLHGADWKYGYPHKFYVKIINPNPERQVIISSGMKMKDDAWQRVDEYGPSGPILHGKFYMNHLQLIDIDIFNEIIPYINDASGITFARDEHGIKYSSPHFDFQKV